MESLLCFLYVCSSGSVLLINFRCVYLWFKIGSELECSQGISFRRQPLAKIDFSGVNVFLDTLIKKMSELVERVFLLKTSYFGYWNNVSMNRKFIGIFLISFSYTFLIHLTGVIKSDKFIWDMTVFATIFNTFFWNERSAYYSKWTYLANLYNEVLKATPLDDKVNSTLDKEFSYRGGMEVALAIDIMQMEMWSHDSFKDIVESALRSALAFKDRKNGKIVPDISLMYYNRMTKEEAIEVLDEYHKNILKKEKLCFFNRLSKKQRHSQKKKITKPKKKSRYLKYK